MTNHVLQVKRSFQDACGLSDIADADSGQQQTMLNALNAAIQQISSFAPLSWYGADEYADYIRAPQVITLTGLTTGSRAVTWASISSNAWSNGCALMLAGDSAINRLKRTADSYELHLPYIGSSSSVSATIYQDVIEMPENFLKLKGDVVMIGNNVIQVVATSDQMGSGKENGSPQFVGAPTLARLISRYNRSKARVPFLKLNSLPTSASRIAFEYHLRPLDVSSWSDERYDLVPVQFVESVLLPIALVKLSEFSTLVSESRLAKIQSGATTAFSILDSIADAENGNSRGEIRTGQW